MMNLLMNSIILSYINRMFFKKLNQDSWVNKTNHKTHNLLHHQNKHNKNKAQEHKIKFNHNLYTQKKKGIMLFHLQIMVRYQDNNQCINKNNKWKRKLKKKRENTCLQNFKEEKKKCKSKKWKKEKRKLLNKNNKRKSRLKKKKREMKWERKSKKIEWNKSVRNPKRMGI